MHWVVSKLNYGWKVTRNCWAFTTDDVIREREPELLALFKHLRHACKKFNTFISYDSTLMWTQAFSINQMPTHVEEGSVAIVTFKIKRPYYLCNIISIYTK